MNESHVLYGAATGNSLRAAIALQEAGVQFDVVHVNLLKREHHEPAFVALNPHRKIPVLVTGGASRMVLSQSNAIMLYASETGRRALLPPAGEQRFRALERFFYFVTDVIAVGHASFYLSQTRDIAIGDASRRLQARSRAATAGAEQFLAGGDFMAGDELTLADISAFTFVNSIKDELEWSELPRLRAWHERFGARESVRAAVNAFSRS